MTLTSLLILLLVAAVCGAIGQSIAGYSLGGCLTSMVVGLLGAWLGTWLATEFGFPALLVVDVGGEPFPVVWAVVGSFLFALAVGVLTRGRGRL